MLLPFLFQRRGNKPEDIRSTWLGPGFYPWVPRDPMVGSPGPGAAQWRDLLSDWSWASEILGISGQKWSRKTALPGTHVPFLQGIRSSVGDFSSSENCSETLCSDPQRESSWSPQKQVTGSLLNAHERERDVVKMCFKSKLVSNQSNCYRQNG